MRPWHGRRGDAAETDGLGIGQQGFPDVQDDDVQDDTETIPLDIKGLAKPVEGQTVDDTSEPGMPNDPGH